MKRLYTDEEIARLTNASSDLPKDRDWYVVFLTDDHDRWAATIDVAARNPRDARLLARERAARFLDHPDAIVVGNYAI